MTPSVTALALRSALARIAEVACGARPSSLTTVAKVTASKPIYVVLVDIDHRAALRRYLASHLSIAPAMGNAGQIIFSQTEATKIIAGNATRYNAA